MSSIIKTLLSTISKSLSKRFILGDNINKNPIIVLSTLIFTLDYLQHKYITTGDKKYKKKIKNVEDKINFLKRHCGEICENKNRFIISKGNTPPAIENNEINVLLENLLDDEIVLDYSDYVHNYSDKEFDNVFSMVFKCLEGNISFLVNGEPLQINKSYPKDSVISIDNSNSEYFIKNIYSGENCTGEIIKVDKEFISSHNDYNIKDLKDEDGNFVMQKILGEIVEIPNDTILYAHIDTTSVSDPDITYLNNFFKSWWEDFKMANPNNNSSFIVNTIDNSDLSINHAPGRGDHRSCEILQMNTDFNTINPGSSQIFTEAWLKNPTEGLLRQAYKEGKNDFTLTTDFLDWVEDKSLVVLSYIDESQDIYHEDGTFEVPPKYDTLVPVGTQPTQAYIDDYYFFVFSLRGKLKLFKGVLYPIFNKGNKATTNFLLHSISAIEARNDITLLELQTLLGAANTAMFTGSFRGVNNVIATVQSLMLGNPYTTYNKLKPLGWRGVYTTSTPISSVFDKDGTKEEINELLTSVEELHLISIDEVKYPVETVEGHLCIKVKDDNPVCPLYSNEAIIDFNFDQDCVLVPDCGKTDILDTDKNPAVPLTLTDDMLMEQAGVEFVRITQIDTECMIFYADGGIFNTNDLPIVISKQQLQDGILTITPDGSGYCEALIYYDSSFDNHNYCNNGNTFLIKWTFE